MQFVVIFQKVSKILVDLSAGLIPSVLAQLLELSRAFSASNGNTALDIFN
jgi:sorbitol-specific phosphotransferase system component IIC